MKVNVIRVKLIVLCISQFKKMPSEREHCSSFSFATFFLWSLSHTGIFASESLGFFERFSFFTFYVAFMVDLDQFLL